MAQNSKHFIFLTVLWTRNADRVWLDGWFLLQDVWGVTETILTAEAGKSEMGFYSKIRYLNDIPPSLTHQQGKLDFFHFSTRLKEERGVNASPYLVKFRSGTASLGL